MTSPAETRSKPAERAAPAASARLLSPREVEAHRRADGLVAEAEARLAEARAEAERLKRAAIEEARAVAEREAGELKIAALAESERAAAERLAALEPQIARLICDTVASVIGDLDHAEVSARATAKALSRLKEHRRVRIKAAVDAASAARRAVEMAGAIDLLEIVVDPRLSPGQICCSSDKGHAEVGLDAQIAAATAPWRDDLEERP